jgi:hypothetical protein
MLFNLSFGNCNNIKIFYDNAKSYKLLNLLLFLFDSDLRSLNFINEMKTKPE